MFTVALFYAMMTRDGAQFAYTIICLTSFPLINNQFFSKYLFVAPVRFQVGIHHIPHRK